MYSQDQIRDMLTRSDASVERAVVALYRCQTNSEQSARATTESNGKGFNAYHASYCSGLAQFILKATHAVAGSKYPKRQFGECLSLLRPTKRGLPIDIARKIVLSYVRQLTDMANHVAEVNA